jgi:PIN domain nuclease of toxin-antitoxin system
MGINYLLDTHILLWWVFDDPKLNLESRKIIRNPANRIFVSSVSAWEIATKHRIGKLPEVSELVRNYQEILSQIIPSANK